jgi:hypothetical protein
MKIVSIVYFISAWFIEGIVITEITKEPYLFGIGNASSAGVALDYKFWMKKLSGAPVIREIVGGLQ